MATFGLITEGVTDQEVIQAILEGFFDPDEVDARPFLPIADNTYRHQVESYSNWELVLQYCASSKFAEAFPYIDYVVIQIDTDRCDEPNFGVPKEVGGHAFTPAEIVTAVISKISDTIAPDVWNQCRERIIFAVAVETVECWLLPIYANADKEKRRHLNCLGTTGKSVRIL